MLDVALAWCKKHCYNNVRLVFGFVSQCSCILYLYTVNIFTILTVFRKVLHQIIET